MSDSVQFVDFLGEQFAVPSRLNQRLVIRFQRLAAEGGDTEDMNEAKAAEAAIMLDKMIEQSVRPEDRQRFEDVCDREMPNDEELMRFVADVLSASAGRPTSRPSDSSAGPSNTRENSEGGSSSRVVQRLEQQGRPDLALIVDMAQTNSSAISA